MRMKKNCWFYYGGTYAMVLFDFMLYSPVVDRKIDDDDVVTAIGVKLYYCMLSNKNIYSPSRRLYYCPDERKKWRHENDESILMVCGITGRKEPLS